MQYENIITVCNQTTEHITDLTSDMCDVYLPYITIELFGIPLEWDEEKKEEVLNGIEKGIRIGEISGHLVLGQAIFLNGGDIQDYCDSVSQQIENAVSALMENEGPLTEDSNLFHIIDFSISDSADKEDVQNLLAELPEIIFTHMHVTPDIVSIYPEPLSHEKSKLRQVQEGLAMIAHNEVANRIYAQLLNNEDKNTNLESPQIQISPEQLNIALGRRNIGDSYPEKYIDFEAWKPFMESGFEEWNKTRVLYKKVI